MEEPVCVSEADLQILAEMYCDDLYDELADQLEEAAQRFDPLQEHRERETLLPAFLDGAR